MKRFKNILIVIDDSVDNEIALKRAADLASKNKAKLTAMKVTDLSNSLAGFLTTYSNTHMDLYLKEEHDLTVKKLQPYIDELDLEVLLVQGKPFLEVIKAVIKKEYDLVIKSCQQNDSFSNMIFGSSDMHLLRKCPCPVWLVKPKEGKQYKRVLAAIDIQPSSDEGKLDLLNQQLMEMATSMSLSESAELHFVHAWTVAGQSMVQTHFFSELKDEFDSWMKEQKDEIDKRIKDFEIKLNGFLGGKLRDHIGPKIHSVKGDASEVIPKLVQKIDADLVVMGTVSRSGLPGFFMGNTAEDILSQLNCSVLTVKPKGFVSPVTID